jgi:magnesium-transporting ATPase (P-type)
MTEDGAAVDQPVTGDLRRLLLAVALCTNARLLPPDAETPRWTVLGDPTEAALRVAAVKGGLDLEQETTYAPRVREFPFESRCKRMSTVHLEVRPKGGGVRRVAATG